jgi:hypothetical protein
MPDDGIPCPVWDTRSKYLQSHGCDGFIRSSTRKTLNSLIKEIRVWKKGDSLTLRSFVGSIIYNRRKSWTDLTPSIANRLWSAPSFAILSNRHISSRKCGGWCFWYAGWTN